MSRYHQLQVALSAVATLLVMLPLAADVQAMTDRDAEEINRYRLTDAALAKHTRAGTNFTALVKGRADYCDHAIDDEDDSDEKSLDQLVAELNAVPGVRQAISSAGLTTREYLVFGFAMLQAAMASWALEQPGAKLPTGTLLENAKFYRARESDIAKMSEKYDDTCREHEEAEEDDPLDTYQ